MTSSLPADAVLKELWAVKDETAKRFGTLQAYFDYLRQSQTESAKLVPKRTAKPARAGAKVSFRRGRLS